MPKVNFPHKCGHYVPREFTLDGATAAYVAHVRANVNCTYCGRDGDEGADAEETSLPRVEEILASPYAPCPIVREWTNKDDVKAMLEGAKDKLIALSKGRV